jgi:hypothetical protein
MGKPIKKLVHDDGPCAPGKLYTPLVDGLCPICKFHPDMQSTSFMLFCEEHDQPLVDGSCPDCRCKENTGLPCPYCQRKLPKADIQAQPDGTFHVAVNYQAKDKRDLQGLIKLLKQMGESAYGK